MRAHSQLLALGVLAAFTVAAAPAMADAGPAGLWSVANGKAEINIEECGASLCGRLVSARRFEQNPDILDKKNKNPALRLRKVKGLQVLSGFVPGGPSEWKDGQIYNPDDGGTYKANIKQIDDDTLKVAGCIVWPLCKSTRLTRIHTDAAARPGFAVARGQ